MNEAKSDAAALSGRASRSLRCDFCGRESPRVRRVALDEGYDRLGKRHAVRYACADCSVEKEAKRATQVDGQPKPL